VKTHSLLILAKREKLKPTKNALERSTIADEMRLFFVPVEFVAFSRQKVGNASDANRKTAQTCNKLQH
jgi:hypothetical protein